MFCFYVNVGALKFFISISLNPDVTTRGAIFDRA